MSRKILFFTLGVALLGLVLAGSRLYAEHTAKVLTNNATTAFESQLAVAFDSALGGQDEAVAVLTRRFRRIDDLKTAQELRLRRHRG
ncbi:MAG: hypothetical protein ACR2GR_12380, partial [Rhodothermales bacterium]